ncbi:MAG: STM4015 family protein [Verrucomicrobia bacterium]|nr:STM4015 family protein [Verrucomicrobiota bacterium]
MKRELVYMDSKSSKFWNLELKANTYTVTYGRIGTAGQTLTKSFTGDAEALKDAEKLIKEKLGKGYVDAGGSGASASGSSDQPGDLIPLLAFSSILRREDISSNMGTFIGRRVVDYDPEKDFRSELVPRFRGDYDENPTIANLKHFLASDLARECRGLVVGAWHGDDTEGNSEEVIQELVQGSPSLPNLSALYIGDITSEECEISWIHQSDLSPLLKAFPKLQLLRARGGDGLRLSQPSHTQLRGLALETGGMDVEVIRSVCQSDFPNLEYLELWLGTDEYGANHSIADLQPILSGRLFPKLKYLGLRNSQQADELAGVLVNSPILNRLETLDLSLGVLTNDGAKSLLQLPPSPTLKKLNLHYNFIDAALIRQLKALPLTVDASKPADMDDDEEWRFVAVGE